MMKQQFSWGEGFLCRGWVLSLGLLLLSSACPLLGQNEQQASKTLGSSDIIAMLESAKSRKLKGGGYEIKHCNKIFSEGEWDTGRACTLAASKFTHTEPFDQLQQLGSDDMSQVELALLRACAFGSDKMGPRNPCGELGGFYEARGDLDMAMAVYQQAPECVHPHHDEFAFGNGALLTSVMHWAGPHCLGGQWRVTSKKGDVAGERVVVSALCTTYNLPDACSRFQELGAAVAMTAVQARYNENVSRFTQEASDQQDRRNEHNREASARRQESDASFSETINNLSNPNAIVDAGNQQAAQIRATGDANAAQQQAAAQQRLATQQAAQQEVQERAAAQQAAQIAAQQSQEAQHAAKQSTSSSTANNSSGSGGNGASGENSGTYLAPITQRCVREFWDPKFYNWLSFQNDCGQEINLTWIAKSPNDHFGPSGGDIAAGRSANTGWSKSEVAAKGDFALFVCPAGSVAVDATTRQMVSNPNATYSCKKQ